MSQEIETQEGRLPRTSIKQLEGKLLTIIDAAGMPEKQEKAVKDQISNTLWNDLFHQTFYFATIERLKEFLADGQDKDHPTTDPGYWVGDLVAEVRD